MAKTCQKKNIPFLSLTSFGENTLSQMSDAKLYISTRENLTHNIANFNSNLSIYFLLDLLYASYFSLDYENNFNKKISAKTGEAIVAAAGPIMNFLLAIVLTIILYALQIFATNFVNISRIGIIIFTMLQYAVIVNVGLGVFNLIPLPPLDGSKVLMAFLPYNAKRWFENHERTFLYNIFNYLDYTDCR